MHTDTRARLEADIRARYVAGDLEGAMHAALDGYGGELYGFLVGLARDAAMADDAFGVTCERLWRGLPGFRWESSFRVWAYTIARHVFLRLAIAPSRRETPVSSLSSLQPAIDRIRTRTPLHMRTEVKARLARIREALAPEERMLLGLRIDRDLPWDDVAAIMGEEAATLRKRFERLKVRLKELLAHES